MTIKKDQKKSNKPKLWNNISLTDSNIVYLTYFFFIADLLNELM